MATVVEGGSDSSSPFSVPNASPIPTSTGHSSNEPLATGHGEPHKQQKEVDNSQCIVWEYPPSVSLPSKELLESLYQHAMQSDSDSDQPQLANYGILSLEDVLLPAVSHQHNQVLRSIQAIVQRDAPECVSQITLARQALYQTTAMARQVAQASRQRRKEEQQRAKIQAQKDQEEYRALKRLACQRDLKKKYPPNQETWREVAYLMTELQKLEKEERVWKQADKDLEQQILLAQNNNDDAEAMDLESDDESEEKENSEERGSSSQKQVIMEKVQDINLACTRIEESIDVLQKAMNRTQILQRQVAQVHDETRFGGLFQSRGNGNQTKDLVRIMSQEDSIQ